MNQSTPKKLIIDHLRGSKDGQSESFNCESKSEWLLGRSNDMDVVFDPTVDDVVSRKHAKISLDNDHNLYVEDLNSSNGTFLNGKKITSRSQLGMGDEISLGENGPKLTFDLDPRPENFIKGTRVLSAPETAGATTIIQQSFNKPSASDSSSQPASQKAGIGKETLEYELKKTRSSGRRTLMMVAGALLIIIAGVLYAFNQNSDEPMDDGIMTPEAIGNENAKNVGMITFGWKLVHSQSGEDVYHYYEQVEDKIYPVYIKNRYGRIEPYLVTKDYNNISKRVALQGRGTGFLFTDDGFMITNRHVAAGWEAPYPLEYPGVLMEFNEEGQPVFTEEVKSYMVGNWVPSKATTLNRSYLENNRSITGDILYLNVQFPETEQPIEATLSNYSVEADVAIVKVNIPKRLTYCKLNADDEINIGEEVVVLGYPGNSKDAVRRVENEDIVQRGTRYVVIAEPTLTNGTIAKVHDSNSDDQFSQIGGNVYQLNINTTGGGNSGGPVFNDRGEVIGIYSYGHTNWREMIHTSYAVPIEYAMKAANILD